MIRMSKLINKKFLKEDWGDLIAISPNIRSSLKNRVGSRYSNKTFGKNSTVKVLHLSGKELYELLTAGEDNGRNNDILSVVIRYGQQDMILLIICIHIILEKYRLLHVGSFIKQNYFLN